ncbi:MAG: OsmC family protein [Oceanospirillaceae bacterium]
MQVTTDWDGDVRFKGTTGSGFEVMIDGEQKQGPRPLEMMLLGVAGCSSYDVLGILKKSRQDVVDCSAQVTAERADAVPSVFTKIHIKFIVTGRDIKEKQVERAVRLSADEYCSASIMLKAAGVEIFHSYEIIEVA